MLKKIINDRLAVAYSIVILFLTLSFITRIGFYFWSLDFINFSLINLLIIVFTGIFFDIGTVSFFTILYLIYLSIVPNKWVGSKFDRVATYIFFFVPIIAFTISFFIEFTFWDEFQTRFNFIAIEYLLHSNQINDIHQYYPIPLLLLIISTLVFLQFFVVNKLNAFEFTFSSYRKNNHNIIILSGLIVPLFFALLIKNDDAEWSKNRYENEISKAGVYSFFAALKNNKSTYSSFYESQDIDDSLSLLKATDSTIIHNSLISGSNPLKKYSDTIPPLIINIKPHADEILNSPFTKISADFTDGLGSGIDLSTFSLFINKGMNNEIVVNQNTTKSDGLINISSNGFLYNTIIPLRSQVHDMDIKISDKQGNTIEKSTSFKIDIKSYNTNISNLPIDAMEGIDIVNAEKLYAANIKKVGDLVNMDPEQLKIDTGLSLKFCATEIQRARIVCTKVRFDKGKFQELFSLTMKQIMEMSNQELIAMDIEVENWQEVQKIRENIGLLYVCIDEDYVDNMTFGQLTWDQV